MFERHHLTDPGLVWDPMVHKYFGEDCFFVLLHLPDTRDDVISDIESLRVEMALPSFCCYTLHGFYDVLIRVWSTPDAVEDLVARIRDKVRATTRTVFTDPVVFHVRKTFYDGWTVHDENVDQRTVVKYLDDIRYLTPSYDLSEPGVRSAVEQRIDALRKARLLHEIDPASHGLDGDQLIKFFVVLQGHRVTADYNEEIAKIRRIIAMWDSVQLVSVYYGSADNSDMRCLVKGVVSVAAYPEIHRAVGSLSDLLRRDGLEWRTMTLLVSDPTPYEADMIDSEHSQSHRSEYLQLGRWGAYSLQRLLR
jgi:hypothetical protein